MKRALAIAICIAFLLFGLVRTGVGILMIGEVAGWWAFGGEAAEAVAGTRAFIAEAPGNIVGFAPLTYFAYIVLMGLVLIAGALGQIFQRRWGLGLIVAYIAMHGFLFVNFLTINPKMALLGVAVAGAALLAWANRPSRPELHRAPA